MTTATKQTGVALSPLDNPRAWATPAYEPPLDMIQIARYQATIDSIIGTTRDEKSIAKLVWNGDRRYWKDLCINWDTEGDPIEWIKRPIVLYRTVRDHRGKIIRDEFPPRWLILTRIEPEQYVPYWGRDSKVYMPDRGAYVQVKPPVPPAEMHVWFMTIAEHNGHCCRLSAQKDMTCLGQYAGPNKGIEELRKIRKGMEERGIAESAPFDSPDRLSQKLRDRGVNNYIEQALNQYDDQASRFIDAVPFKKLKHVLNEEKKRDLDEIELAIKGKIL